MQIREYDGANEERQCVFLYPLVLLHEQELQNDFGDACALQDGVTRVARAIRRASRLAFRDAISGEFHGRRDGNDARH
jgi:hypothetical protein